MNLRTIQIDLGLLNYLLKRAFEYNMITRKPKMPSMLAIRRKSLQYILVTEEKHARGAFTEDQNEVLSKWQRKFRTKWIDCMEYEQGLSNPDEIPKIARRRDTRFSLVRFYMMVSIVKAAGLRPMELAKMTVGCVEPYDADSKTYTLIQVSPEMSKVNKRRESVCNDMDSILIKWSDYLYEWERFYGRPPKPNDYAFPSLRDSNKLIDRGLAKDFKYWIRKIEEEIGGDTPISYYMDSYEGVEKPISLYSFRKYYITKALRNPELTPYLIAANLGTSVFQLERAYDFNLGRYHRGKFTAGIRYLKEMDEANQDFIVDEE